MASIISLPGLPGASDEQAMLQVKERGDCEAFAELMRRWEKPIQRLATRMTGDSHRGQDVAQDVFARLFARRDRYQPSGKFSTRAKSTLMRMLEGICRWTSSVRTFPFSNIRPVGGRQA